MRALIQRVSQASVTVDGKVISQIGKGYLILLGILKGDTEADAALLANKAAKLRIFTGAEDKMNLSLQEVDGSILAVSNFTLAANCRRGNRPDFSDAAGSQEAEPLYRAFLNTLRNYPLTVETGIFGADMKLTLVNDGPVTVMLDTDDLKQSRR